jgi:tape measure domain-containing protein
VLKTVAAAAAPLLGALAAIKGAKAAIGGAAELESTSMAFEVLIGDAAKAQKTLEGLRNFAASTPFEFPELADAARKLIAFGEGADTVVGALRRIGDVASGVQAPISEIAEIYGKARVQGQLFAEDLNQLSGRGIPVIAELAKVLKMPESAIKKLGSEGKITFPLLDQAFRNLTSQGGKFAGMMQKQSGTTLGLWSSLKDAVNEAFVAMGQPLNDAMRPVLSDAITLAAGLKPVMAEVGTLVGGAVTGIRNFIAYSQLGGGVVAEMGRRLQEAFSGLFEMAMGPIRAIGAALGVVFEGLMPVFGSAAVFLGTALEAAAGRFVAAMLEGLAEVFMEIPLMGDAARKMMDKASEKRAASADLDRQLPQQAQALADSVKKLPATLAEAMTALKAGLGFGNAKKAGDGFVGPPSILAGGGGGSKAPMPVTAAPGLTEAITAAAAEGTRKGAEQGKKATGTGGAATSSGGTPAADVAGKKIQGFSRKEAGLKDFGGLDEFNGLQDLKKKGVRVGERFKQPYGGLPRDPAAVAAGASGGGTAGGSRGGRGGSLIQRFSRFGGLAEFNGLQDMKKKGIGVGERFKAIQPLSKPPGLVPAGVASKRQRQKEAEAAAAKAVEPRWDLVEAIDQKLAGLGLV